MKERNGWASDARQSTFTQFILSFNQRIYAKHPPCVRHWRCKCQQGSEQIHSCPTTHQVRMHPLKVRHVKDGGHITHSCHDEQCSALISRRNRHSHYSWQRNGKRPPSCLQIKVGRCAAARPPPAGDSTASRLYRATSSSPAPLRVWVHRPSCPAAFRGPQQPQWRSRTHSAAGPQSPRPGGAGQRSREASRRPKPRRTEPERSRPEATILTPGSPHCRRS